jgi:ribosomal protein L7/L12
MEMQTLVIGAGLFVLGFLIGRITAPKERSTTVYHPVRALDDRQSASGSDIATVDPEIEAAILAGRKIAAIKLYRKMYGADLKGAKDSVDAIEARLRIPGG